MEKQQIREQKLDAKPHLICSISSSFLIATSQEGKKKKKKAEKVLTVSVRTMAFSNSLTPFPLK